MRAGPRGPAGRPPGGVLVLYLRLIKYRPNDVRLKNSPFASDTQLIFYYLASLLSYSPSFSSPEESSASPRGRRTAVTLAPSKVRHDTSVPERRGRAARPPAAPPSSFSPATPNRALRSSLRDTTRHTTSPLRSCRDELWARGNKAENALHLLGRPCAPTRVLVSCPTCALGAHRPKGCPG